MSDDVYGNKLAAIIEPYDEVIALWEDKSHPHFPARSYIAVADTELARNLDALHHELVMQIIRLESDAGVLCELSLVEPMFAPSTKDMGDNDFLLRRWGYDTPDTAIRDKARYDPYLDELVGRESLIADVLAEHPDKLARVAEFSVERCAGVLEGYEPIRAAHEQWDEMIRRYPVDLLLGFLRSKMLRHRDIVLASPFIALYDELFERWLDDDGNVRKLADVVPGAPDGQSDASGLADVLAAVNGK